MPSVSEKQRKYMGMQLAKKRAGKGSDVKMSEQQLREFASKTTRSKETRPGRSIVDVETVRRDPKTSSIDGGIKHPIHNLKDSIIWGSDEFAMDGKDSTPGNTSALRDIGNGIHYGATVYHHGPDTDFRAEEINLQHYGRDYEPFPYKDMLKGGEKVRDAGVRRVWDDCYQETETPGAVTGTPKSSLAYGTISFEEIPSENPDNRTYDRQMKFERAHEEIDAELHDEDD